MCECLTRYLLYKWIHQLVTSNLAQFSVFISSSQMIIYRVNLGTNKPITISQCSAQISVWTQNALLSYFTQYVMRAIVNIWPFIGRIVYCLNERRFINVIRGDTRNVSDAQYHSKLTHMSRFNSEIDINLQLHTFSAIGWVYLNFWNLQ